MKYSVVITFLIIVTVPSLLIYSQFFQEISGQDIVHNKSSSDDIAITTKNNPVYASITTVSNNNTQTVNGTINDLEESLIQTIQNISDVNEGKIELTVVNEFTNQTYQIQGNATIKESIGSEIEGAIEIINKSNNKLDELTDSKILFVVNEASPKEDIIDLVQIIFDCIFPTICV